MLITPPLSVSSLLYIDASDGIVHESSGPYGGWINAALSVLGYFEIADYPSCYNAP